MSDEWKGTEWRETNVKRTAPWFNIVHSGLDPGGMASFGRKDDSSGSEVGGVGDVLSGTGVRGNTCK